MTQMCSATLSLSLFLCDIRKPCICASPGVWHCLECEESAEGGVGGSSFSATVWMCSWSFRYGLLSITSSEWKIAVHAALPHPGMPSGCDVVWCVFSYAHMCVRIHMHVCTLTYMCMHAHKHSYMCTGVWHMHSHVYMCTSICMYVSVPQAPLLLLYKVDHSPSF